jgi:hypothetical protein
MNEPSGIGSASGPVTNALALASVAVGAVLTIRVPFLMPVGMAFIASGLFALAYRWQGALAQFIRSPRPAWIPDTACVVLLVGLTLLMLGNVAAGDRPMGFDHPVHYFQAWQFKERFWKDGWFYWSNLWFAGYPANYTYSAGAYLWIALVHWLTFGISFSWAYSFGFWLFYVFHGFSVYFLGKVAFNRIVGLGAAVLYLTDRGATSSGGWFWTVDVGTWPVALSIAFSTMATALLARVLEEGNRRDAVWGGVFIGLALLTHPLQLVYVPILCGVAFVLSPLVVTWTRLRAHAVYAAAAVGCGLLIGAAWYVPFLSYSEYSRAYGWQWLSIEEIGANIYQGTLFPAGGTLMSGEAIKSDVMALVPQTIDGLSVYISVLSILVLPILFLSKRLLPLLLATLTFALLVGAASTLHDAVGISNWWASYNRMEFARFVMLFKPFMCVGAAVGVWALWNGVKASISRIGFVGPVSVWSGWVRVFIAVSLVLWPTLPAVIVVLNRHVFLATPTKSMDRTNADRERLVTWIRMRFADDRRFFRVAARGNDEGDHSLTDLGTELPVPMLHLGYTPAMPFRYTMGASAVFLPMPSDSNATFKALNVRYVISKVPVERSDWKFVRQFGLLGLYEFTDWNPNPYVISDGQGSVDVMRFEPHEIELRAAPGSHGRLRLNVSYFPRWSAQKDGRPIAIDVSSVGEGTGFMTVDLSPGTYRFRFSWGIAEWLGLLLALLGVCGLTAFASPSLRRSLRSWPGTRARSHSVLWAARLVRRGFTTIIRT